MPLRGIRKSGFYNRNLNFISNGFLIIFLDEILYYVFIRVAPDTELAGYPAARYPVWPVFQLLKDK